MTRGADWDLPGHLASASASGARSGTLAAGPDRQATLRRATNRVSNSIVLALMVATSGVALFDLYLLASQLPR
ncbi:MAG TPA: hypothetical protein VK425_13030 [Acidimicrobiales bacterium]|nr:hypothetical protein [Acidimicrobiales bacterium]